MSIFDLFLSFLKTDRCTFCTQYLALYEQGREPCWLKTPLCVGWVCVWVGIHLPYSWFGNSCSKAQCAVLQGPTNLGAISTLHGCHWGNKEIHPYSKDSLFKKGFYQKPLFLCASKGLTGKYHNFQYTFNFLLGLKQFYWDLLEPFSVLSGITEVGPHETGNGNNKPTHLNTLLAKRYFKLLQALHHTEILDDSISEGSCPKGMQRRVNRLSTFIKPAR